MECFKVLYIWKSLYGQVPSLGLQWSDTGNRSGHILTVSKLKGPESVKSLQKTGIKQEGIRLFNSSPVHLRLWDGTADSFKVQLDKYLEHIPDQPWTDTMIPGCNDIMGNPSNSIIDWGRV